MANQYYLNQGQEEGAEKIFGFLMDPEQIFFNLTGPAGVGKTYLMRYIKDVIMKRYYELCRIMGIEAQFDTVDMTATTHKAAAVLAKAIGASTTTVHSYFGLTVFNDYKTGRTEIRRNPRKWQIQTRKIIFIDEASMIDGPLFNEIRTSIEGCKIIFVGDHCQLPPVGERISLIYQQNFPTAELTQQMRNDGQPALMNLCSTFRSVVEGDIDFPEIPLVPGVIDHLEGEELQAEIDSHFIDMGVNNRILSYTNQSVIENNSYIRELRKLPEIYQPGERVINVSPYIANNKDPMIPAETEVTISRYNGVKKEMLEVGGNEPPIEFRWLDYTLTSGLTARVPANLTHYKEIISFFKSRKNWKAVYYLQERFADLRPAECSTVHKAQGSTHDVVFVDLSNIGTNNNRNEVARMLYVAFSRPRQRLVLAGELPPKYGSVQAK